MTRIWQVSVDVGGTFTDAIATDPEGRHLHAKVLSSGAVRALAAPTSAPDQLTLASFTDASVWGGAQARIGTVDAHITHTSASTITLDRPHNCGTPQAIELKTGEPAPALAARVLTGTPLGKPFPPITLRLATTRGTNALLERRHPKIALLVTEGFADLLRIADQRRPELFALDIRKPEPITDLVFEIPGRLDAQGRELRPLDGERVRTAIERARAQGAEVIAIALIHAWRNPDHERQVREWVLAAGLQTAIASSDIAARLRLLPRATSACVEAALAPVLASYLREIDGALGDGPRFMLTSAGALHEFASARPVDALLSGPAGGVVGAAEAGRRAGFDRVIAFDMGGTSTDVSRLDPDPARVASHEVGGVRVARPAVEIETVAAGGGSICAVRDGRPRVGPQSAGAEPGPACYGRGGPLTITDCNLLLGRIDRAQFTIPIDIAAAERAADDFAQELGRAGAKPTSREDLLAGLIELADLAMAEAIRKVSARRGYDPATYALVAFGGAGPQHACSVARRLAIRTVIIPPHASLLSAVGVAAARVQREAERQLLQPLDTLIIHTPTPRDTLTPMLDELEREASASLAREASTPNPVITRRANLRLVGQESTIELDASDARALPHLFNTRARELWGAAPTRPIEVESIRVTAAEPPTTHASAAATPMQTSARAVGEARVFDNAQWIDAKHFVRDALTPGDTFRGPALITEAHTATWLPADWRATLDANGALILSDQRDAPEADQVQSAALRRELYVMRLAGIAESMGEVLRRTAVSTNIKERLDYSCAVLDAEGRVVASAPHIPVHLGALGACVRAVRDALPDMAPGDAALTNHPAFGGSHLPDLTVVQPVHTDGGALVGYVASRAHHAEIGGRTPGSMPPDARTLEEEGVVFEPILIARAHEPQLDEAAHRLRHAPFPSRVPDDNIADLGAALAAGRHAAQELRALTAEVGIESIRDAMAWILDHTAALVRTALQAWSIVHPDTQPTPAIVEQLDDGSEIRLRVRASGEGITLEFTGTSPTHATNLNAPLAVTRSAVAYVMRLLVGRPIPLNDALLDAVRLDVPEGTMLNPHFEPGASPAVAGGNVETSQRVVEALIRVFGLAAGSQGTMNNLLIGNASFGYYETIAGGAGAGPTFDGADGVQVHMTNTATTDAEVVEHRYPLRVERFAIRTGSGGAGAHRGGDGVVRELTALEPIEVTLVTQRRTSGAPGAQGGEDGAPGSQEVHHPDGSRDTLPASAHARLDLGDRLIIHTPGGGGWGSRQTP